MCIAIEIHKLSTQYPRSTKQKTQWQNDLSRHVITKSSRSYAYIQVRGLLRVVANNQQLVLGYYRITPTVKMPFPSPSIFAAERLRRSFATLLHHSKMFSR